MTLVVRLAVVGAVLEQQLHSVQIPKEGGTVQWSHAFVVGGIRVGEGQLQKGAEARAVTFHTRFDECQRGGRHEARGREHNAPLAPNCQRHSLRRPWVSALVV